MIDNLVSIIMPSYKAEIFITESIESVIYQTYKNWELIVIDDCSPDKSNTIINKYIKKFDNIKLIKLENNVGPAISRNIGLSHAKGRYIAFLDSDDIWLKNKLLIQIQFMKYNKASLSFTGYNQINECDSSFIKYISIPTSISYHELLKQNIIGCLTAIYDTKILGKVYMPEIYKRQDYALWLKILKITPLAHGINQPLAEYRVRSSSISSNKFSASLYNWKLYKDVENLPFHKAAYYFSHFAIKSIIKYVT